MRDSRFGKFLLGIGAIVGVSAGVALTLGFRPSELPAALLDIAAYKLVFISAAVLMGAGAALRRYVRQDVVPVQETNPTPTALGQGAAEPLPVSARPVAGRPLNTPT